MAAKRRAGWIKLRVIDVVIGMALCAPAALATNVAFVNQKVGPGLGSTAQKAILTLTYQYVLPGSAAAFLLGAYGSRLLVRKVYSAEEKKRLESKDRMPTQQEVQQVRDFVALTGVIQTLDTSDLGALMSSLNQMEERVHHG